MRKLHDEAGDCSSDFESPSCLDLVGDLAGGFDSGRSDAGTDRLLIEEAMLSDAQASASAVEQAGDD